MSLELDHIFCFCSSELREAKALEDAGFVLTKGRKHQGQGTANRSLLFQSNYLELIYLESEGDAMSNPLHLHLRANWKVTRRSPFGIALRGEVPTQNRSQFWEYRPPYDPSRVILMHEFSETHPEFPLLFVMPSSLAPIKSATELQTHRSGSTQIKNVTIQSPFPNWPLSTQVEGLLIEGGQHGMDVQMDGGLSGVLELNEVLRVRMV